MGMFDDLTPQQGGGGGMFSDLVPPKKEVGTIDRVKAGAAGVNKGFYSDLLGLPVDTAANVLDLAKAAIGYGTSKVTGKAPPEWTAPSDRGNTIGSAEWIAKKINDVGLGGAINNPNPQDATSRVLYSGGRVGGSSVVPNPKAQISGLRQLANFSMGEAGGLAAGLAGEASPEWAGLSGMSPQLATALATKGFKAGFRGGETGRREMEQRIQDFKNAGVDEPSVGLATGNKTIQGIENILSQTPGSVGLYDRNKTALLEGMRARTNQLRDKTSAVYGPEETGIAIQNDLRGSFKKRISDTQEKLMDRVAENIGPEFYVPVDASISKATKLSTPIKGAEATSTSLINPRIAELANNLKIDAFGVPLFGANANAIRTTGGSGANHAPGMTWEKVPGPYGSPIFVQKPEVTQATTGKTTFDSSIPQIPLGITSKQTAGAETPMGIPFDALRRLRADIGQEASSNAIVGTPEQAQFKQLYGAMSSDMRQGVNSADRVKAGVPVGPLQTSQEPGTAALNRSNQYWSRAMTRADDLDNIANRSTPEKAYEAVSKSLESGPTVYQRLRGAVTTETRQKVVASVIDGLGKATPGQQGADGDAWSPRTFLTNYNKMDGQARTELFKRIPGGEKLAADLKDVAKAAEMVSDSSKVWANPSGTTAAAVSRGTLGTLALGATAGLFYTPLLVGAAGTASGLLIGNQVSQRLLLNPKFVNWLAKAPKVRPQDAQSYAQRLIANARMTNDKQFQQDVAEYFSALNQAGAEQQ